MAAIDAADPSVKKLLNSPSFTGTVFAPTNEAFALLISALNTTPEALLSNKKLLTAVLNYHVIPDDVLTKKKLASIQDWGTNLGNTKVTITKSKAGTIRVYYGEQTFNQDNVGYDGSAKVIKADVKADHAIVDVIDRVLVPAP